MKIGGKFLEIRCGKIEFILDFSSKFIKINFPQKTLINFPKFTKKFQKVDKRKTFLFWFHYQFSLEKNNWHGKAQTPATKKWEEKEENSMWKMSWKFIFYYLFTFYCFYFSSFILGCFFHFPWLAFFGFHCFELLLLFTPSNKYFLPFSIFATSRQSAKSIQGSCRKIIKYFQG